MGFLDPEVNAVRYRSRRHFPSMQPPNIQSTLTLIEARLKVQRTSLRKGPKLTK